MDDGKVKAKRPRPILPTEVDKHELDRRVAIALQMLPSEVALITRIFFREVVQELSEMNDIHLNGLGRLRVNIRKGKRAATAVLTEGTYGLTKTSIQRVVEVKKKYYVTFRRAPSLVSAIQLRQGKGGKVKKVMEKLGVDEEQTDLEKMASDGCPGCGGPVNREGNVLICPRCGTEPFERLRGKQQRK